MKCHYDWSTGSAILIPGCWQVVMSGDFDDCTCAPNPHIEYMKQLKKQGKIQEMKEYRKIYREHYKYSK